MSNYIGVRCPVCNKKFTEADDIVVCPICGAPHHRDCYMKENQCAFVADHLSGKEWSDPAGQVPPSDTQAEDKRVCARCSANNPPNQIFCQVCGNPLSLQPPSGEQKPEQQWGYPGSYTPVDTISMAYGGLSPEEEIDGESVKDIAQYVGGGSAYYLPRFRLMSEDHRSFMPSLSAFIFYFYFFFYRKMYLVGCILLALYFISSIPLYLYWWEVFPDLMRYWGITTTVQVNIAAAEHLLRLNNITRAVSFVIRLIVSVYANRHYYQRVIVGVHAVRTGVGAGKPPKQYQYMLSEAGGSSKVAVVVVGVTVLTIMFVIVAVMLSLQMPA